jgi:hypothetical protein
MDLLTGTLSVKHYPTQRNKKNVVDKPFTTSYAGWELNLYRGRGGYCSS